MSDEYPGVKRLRVRFTDPGEIDFDWPFVALEREIESIDVDGEKWVAPARLQERIDDLEELVRDLWPRASFTMAAVNRHGWMERLAELGIEVDGCE